MSLIYTKSKLDANYWAKWVNFGCNYTYTSQLAPEHTRMAMAVTGQNRHYEWVRILRRHWISAARTCGIFQEVAQAIIVELVENTPAVITKVSAVLRSTFPVDVANSIFNGMRASTFKLAGAS